MTEKLRSGYTTGACAAAAAKAAVLAWFGNMPQSVEITTPQGIMLNIPIHECSKRAAMGQAEVIKDAGDDPDITNGVKVIAEVELLTVPEIYINAGCGVGRVTKPGLAVQVGQPAINPGPQQMIRSAVRGVLPPGRGAVVTVSIPGGEALATRTLNPILGIAGGLSVLGSTGIVRPMSEEAFKNSLVPQISVVRALGFDTAIFVPGGIGQEIATKQLGLPPDAVVQTSNFIGHMLEQAVQAGLRKVILCGHLGKLVKVAGGIFHTHNRLADARMEILSAYLALQGATQDIIEQVMNCTTTEAAMPIIKSANLTVIYEVLATKASIRAMRYVFGDLQVGTIILTLNGEVLGMDDTARELRGIL